MTLCEQYCLQDWRETDTVLPLFSPCPNCGDQVHVRKLACSCGLVFHKSYPLTIKNASAKHVHVLEAGKTFNSAKSDTLKEFLAFVGANSHPNSRSADSTGSNILFYSQLQNYPNPQGKCCRLGQKALSWESLTMPRQKLERRNAQIACRVIR